MGDWSLPGEADHVVHGLPGVLDPPEAPRLPLPQELHHELLAAG